jgi:hypothetical protein
MVMEYEIYTTTNGNTRVNIGEGSYAIGGDGGVELEGRQYQQVLRGDYGEVVQAFALAAQECGITPRFAWRGVINSMGDHGNVLPPYNPRARDYAR